MTQAGPSQDVVKRVCAAFAPAADAIVRDARDTLSRRLETKLARCVGKLTRQDLSRITGRVTVCFAEKKMGLSELESLALREIAIHVIRRCTDRYRESLLDGGIGPVEYFERFYCNAFVQCGLAAKAISVVDPNLHRVAKKIDKYPELTSSLEKAARTIPSPPL